MAAENPSLALQLAEYIVSATPADIPRNVRHEALRSFINWLGCAIGGSSHEAINAMERALEGFAGPPQATKLGRKGSCDILSAALLNGTSSSIYGFDDTHAEMIVHPTGPVAASILALAERKTVTGPEFLSALVIGIEIECRLSRAASVPPARCDVGWYMTGLTGGVGAAAAVGKLLGLDATRLVWAMGIAAGEASGFRAMHATMCSGLVPAHAGQTGLRAALLAEQGFTSSQRYLEGPRGFLELFAAEANPDALTDALGERFEILLNTYKPYPCGIVIHPIVDACLQLTAAHRLDGKDIERVHVKCHPTTITLTDRRHPKDDMEAVVSLYHWAAAVLIDGAAGLDEMSDRRIHDNAVARLRDKVEATADPSLKPDQAEVAVFLKDGRRLARSIEHCVGSAARPMTDEQIGRKFRELSDGIIGASNAEALLRACWNMADLGDVGAIARAAA